MKSTFEFLNTDNFRYLIEGITLYNRDFILLDNALKEFDKKTGIMSQILKLNASIGSESSLNLNEKEIIFTLDKFIINNKQLSTVMVSQRQEGPISDPMIHINLFSPTLQIPQRLEIPLRYILQGLKPLVNTHMVYLHVLEFAENKFVYYGVTKRGWMKRFNEHVKDAIKRGSNRKFPQVLSKGIKARFEELIQLHFKATETTKVLLSTQHVVCAAGRSSQNAFAIEKYLIDKWSISSEIGLNMIRGKSVGNK